MVALQHLEPGRMVVAEVDGLRGLKVGEAGHDDIGFAPGHVEDAGLQAADLGQQRVDFFTHVEADVGGDLIVARAAGVQLFAVLFIKRP